MSAGFERFEIEVGGGSTGLLTPGRVIAALACGAGITAEEIGIVEPLRHGVATVEIALGRAARIGTPRLLPSEEGGRPALFLLRRPDDLPEEGRAELLLSIEGGGEAPRPGEVALALADALGIGQEEIGFGLRGSDFVRVSVPLGVCAGPLPAQLGIAGKRYKIENLAKKT